MGFARIRSDAGLADVYSDLPRTARALSINASTSLLV
jgi:hypothetical protein